MSILKKQSVAWGIAILMVLAAVGFGLAKAPGRSQPGNDRPNVATPTPETDRGIQAVYDEANVLSDDTEAYLTQRNDELLARHQAMVSFVTVNENSDDLGQFALDYARQIGLMSVDMIVVLDISGENYWLVQGADLVDKFTDEDCSNYAWDYMEADFATGDYDGAVIRLMDALCQWYDTIFVG